MKIAAPTYAPSTGVVSDDQDTQIEVSQIENSNIADWLRRPRAPAGSFLVTQLLLVPELIKFEVGPWGPDFRGNMVL